MNVAVISMLLGLVPWIPAVSTEAPQERAQDSPGVSFALPHGLLLPWQDDDDDEDEDDRVHGRVLVIDYGLGIADETGVDATAILKFGANFGTPILNDELGFQIGGNLGRREGGRFEEDITVGLFNRSGVTMSGRGGAGALLLDYRRTMRDADLFGLRVQAEVEVSDENRVGVRARLPLNQDKTRRFGTFSEKQRFLSRLDFLLTQNTGERVSMTFHVGYMFGDVDSVAVGFRGDVSATRWWGVHPVFEVNFDGDYVFGVEVAFDLGRWIGERRPGWAPPGDRLYRPFPKLEFLELAEETRRP